MAGVEAIGLVLGCTGLVFGLVPPLLDYRSLPQHCNELKGFISRQSSILAQFEAEFRSVLDQDLLCPGTLAMTRDEIANLTSFLDNYRKHLDEFGTLLTSTASTKPRAFLDFKRLQTILSGKTGGGLGTLQQKQSMMQLYMIEAKGYRKKLENSRSTRDPLVPRLAKTRLGRTAAAAYNVPHVQPVSVRPRPVTILVPQIDIVRPPSPTETLVESSPTDLELTEGKLRVYEQQDAPGPSCIPPPAYKPYEQI